MFKISFASAAADGPAKFQSFRSGTMSKLSPFQATGSSRKNTDEDGSEADLGDEKRRIYTGPNPLHNR